MKTTLTQCLLILRNKISKSLTFIFMSHKSAWIQMISIVSLVYVAMFSMAFVELEDPIGSLSQIASTMPLAEYEGVVTVVGNEATLKTPKVTYLLDDPQEILHKSPYFAKNSQLQSFRVCIEAERSAVKTPVKGSYSYKLIIEDLCG